ncbi:MAG: flippase [Nanoarchaeota archaeon]|nr:flippase [Nanoarchaeota archaeon]
MSNTDYFLKKIVKGTGITLIGIFIARLLNLVYKIIIARYGVEEYGLFSLGIVVYSILISFSTLGFSKGITHYISFFKTQEEKEKIKGILIFSFKLLTISSILSAILLFLFSDKIALYFFNKTELSLVLKLLAIAIPITVLTEIFFSLMRSFHSIKYITYSKDLVQNFTKIILTVLFILLGFKLFGIIIAFILAAIVSLILAVYYSKKYIFPYFKETSKAIYSNKTILSYSLPLMFSEGIALIALWTDTLMIGYFLEIKEVALYNAAMPLTNILYIFPFALMVLFFPILSGIDLKTQKDEFKNLIKTIFKWANIVNLFLLVSLILFSKQFLSVFGQDYIPAYNILKLLSVGYFIAYLTIPPTNILLALKKTKLLLFNHLFLLIVGIILNYVLIKSYGILGAAIATTISLSLFSIIILSEYYSITRINPFGTSFLRVLSSMGIIFIISQLFFKFVTLNSIYSSLIFLGFLGIVYLLLLLFTKSFEKQDLMIFKAIQTKFKINLDFLDNFLKRFISE